MVGVVPVGHLVWDSVVVGRITIIRVGVILRILAIPPCLKMRLTSR